MPRGIYQHKKGTHWKITGIRRENMGRKKGCIPWNKGKKGLQINWSKGKKRPENSGENHWRWITDRTKLKKNNERNDMAYKEWRIQVWLRDDWKCKIANQDCKGRLEVHHILNWTDFPELRYEVNNGITLCHFHHPRKWVEEKQLIPTFMDLLSIKLN